MKKNYLLNKLVVLMVLGASSLFSSTTMAQCTAFAGDDFSACALGSIQLSGSSSLGSSEPVLDINQSENNTCMANFAQGDLAQQFTAVASNSCGAGLTFDSAANGSLTISLWSNLPNAGGTQLATGTSTVNNSNMGDVSWSSVTLVPGSFYYLVFTTTNITACVAGSTNNPYSGGFLYANGGFQTFPSFDYTFRTYACGFSADVTWTGPNIVSGANTLNPFVNPPNGQSTYTLTIFDPETNCTASDNVVVTRGAPSSAQVQQNACGPYTWNNTTYTESGQYVQVLENASGCDSTVTLNLSINNYTASAINNGNQTISSGFAASYQWVTCPNFTPIAGATSQTFNVTQIGSYAVIAIGANGCQSTSNCVTIANVSIEDYSTNNVVIYPNPTNELVVIEFNAASAIVEIIDTQGKLIQTSKLISGEQISLKNEQNGVYFIRITTDSATTVHRIVKQ